MEADSRHEIMEVGVFVDPNGREVRKFSQVFGKNKTPDFYHGVAKMRVRMRAPNGQEMVQERTVEFPFPEGTGMQRAFGTFDEVAKKFMDELMAAERSRSAANRVVPAASMPVLVGPDGKPIRG